MAVPAGCNAIPDVFLYDALPYHGESDGYDRLVRLNASTFDFAQFQAKELTYLNEIAQPAFKISTTSNDAEVQTIVNNAAATLGYPGVGLTDQDFKLYDGNDALRGQFPIENGGEEYNGLRMTPTHFGVWLGDLPATIGEDGYTITVQYTTKVDPKLVEGLNGRAYSYNAVGLFQRNGYDVFLGEADSSYWLDHVKAQNILDKSVADFNSETNIITYQVDINPDASGEAFPNVAYIFRDVLDLPGASFIESSFQLSFHGTVTEAAAFVWDSSRETILWRSDDGEVDLSHDLSAGMKDLTSLNVENPTDGSSQFTLTLFNSNNVFALAGPEEFKGRLAPMVLTYQVQLLPVGAEKPTKEKITNSVTASVKPPDGDEVLWDGVKTEFDYTSALHKCLNTVPDGNNGYTAAFIINVDKTTEEWKNVGNTFTVSDKMSKSLVLDVSSIQVYGIKGDNSEELLSGQYTASYDDRANDANFLSVTITDSDAYTKYRIAYNARVQGEAEHTVAYDNVASVNGTSISSEEVKKDVYIQKQDGNVNETNYEVKLLKFDAGNTAVRLKAKFTLYAWEDGKWTEKLTGLTTDDNGELVLNNALYQGLNLGPGRWYKLEETEAPAGYLKSVTFFHIGQADESEKPEGIGSYTTIPLKGGIHQIPNYKASIRLHKMDAEKGELSYLSGAAFALYNNSDCSEGNLLATATEEHPGIYSFDLAGLTADQTYYLKEVEAPDGYRLSDTVYTLRFDQEGNVTLKNGEESVQTDSGGAYLIANESGHQLPETGGPGTERYTLSAIALMAGASLLGLLRRRKGTMR